MLSNVNTYICDGCGKEVDDFLEVKGWIGIEGYIGRTQGICDGQDELSGDMDFCSLGCIEVALDKAREDK